MGMSSRVLERRSLTSNRVVLVGDAAADDDDRRDADQLGVLEAHAGGDTPSRSSNSTRRRRRPRARRPATRQPWRCGPPSLPAITRWTSAGAISRGQHRPMSSSVASAIAATARDTPTPYEPIVRRDRLAVLVQHRQARAPRRTCGRAGRCGRSRCRARSRARDAAVRAGVAVEHLGGLDHAVGGEVAPDGRGRSRDCPCSSAPVTQACRRRCAGRPGSGCRTLSSEPSAPGPM